jgi:hypothetical protein
MLQTCDVGFCVEGEGGGPSCWVLQTLNFNVTDVEFQCYRHMMLVLYRGGGGGGLLMLDVARNTGSQHGRRREEARRYLYVARNLLATLLIMARNTLTTFAPLL